MVWFYFQTIPDGGNLLRRGGMYVRFKRVKLAPKYGDQEYSLHAVLVENRRDARGEPRQQIIAYLGSIRERQMLFNPNHRTEFLHNIQNKLRKLSLTPRELSRIQINLINLVTHRYRASLR